jgi:HD-GYP domain-containing protein (c-di-GMP phosphodiesterase class II)
MSSRVSPSKRATPRTRTVLLTDGNSLNPGGAAELRRRGYAVTMEPDRTSLLRLLAAHRAVAVAMRSSGDLTADTTFLLRVLEADPRVSVLIVGEELDAGAVTHFLHNGAATCITEHLHPAPMADALEKAVLIREAELSAGRKIGHLRASLQDVTRQLDHEALAMRQRWVGSLASLVRLAEASHPHMAGHSLRVADLAGAIAVAMGHTDTEVETIRVAGRLHDLGMIGVPARIIDKAGPLSEEEFAQVRQHPRIASDILGAFPNFAEITRGIRGHHEHWDGSGYPDGLAGDQIPRVSLILAAAEVFDALVSPRPYKRAEDTAAALDRVRAISGRILDPAVCEALIAVVSGRRTLPFLAEARAGVREVPAMKFPEKAASKV